MSDAVGIGFLLDTARGVPLRRRRGYFWSPREIAILTDNWTAGGLRACLALLPARSPRAIYAKAGSLGLKFPEQERTGFARRSCPTTPSIDDAIRRCWESGPPQGAVGALARAIGRRRCWIKRRAVALGLSVLREKEPPWTAEEIDFVCERAMQNVASLSARMRARGWRRTPTAIQVQLKRLHMSTRDPERMSCREVASALGIDGHVVARWIKRLGLPAERRGTARVASQGGDEWVIRRRPLRDWIADNANAINLRKIADPEWFVDLLARP